MTPYSCCRLASAINLPAFPHLSRNLTPHNRTLFHHLPCLHTQVLERVLDLQSVVAHCGGLWSTAVEFSGPERLREGDRKRVKERVLKLVQNSIK